MSRTLTSRLTRLSAVALIAGAATFGVAAPALAHDELIGTELVADTADGSLDSIRLTFSNSIIDTGTEIVVTGPTGTDATDGAPVVAGADVTQQLAEGLSAGAYDAAWRVVSSDGHPIEGTFTFFVAADGSASEADISVVEEDPRHEESNDASPHEHTDGESADHEHTADEGSDGGFPVGGVVAISVVAVAAAGAAAATAVLAHRRRKQAMEGRSPAGSDAPQAPETPAGADAEDQR